MCHVHVCTHLDICADVDIAGWCSDHGSDVDTIAVSRSSREDFVCNFLTFLCLGEHVSRWHQYLLGEISPNPPLYRVNRLADSKIISRLLRTRARAHHHHRAAGPPVGTQSTRIDPRTPASVRKEQYSSPIDHAQPTRVAARSSRADGNRDAGVWVWEVVGEVER